MLICQYGRVDSDILEVLDAQFEWWAGAMITGETLNFISAGSLTLLDN